MGKSDSCSISTQSLYKKEKLQVYWEKEREKEVCSFGMELCFVPAPPILGVLSWAERWRSQWYSTAFPVPTAPLSVPEKVMGGRCWKAKNESEETQRTNSTGNFLESMK